MVIGWDDAYELPIPKRTIGLFSMSFLGWYLDDAYVSRTGSKWNYSNKGGTLVAKFSEWNKGGTFTVDNVTYPQTKVTDTNLITELSKTLQNDGSTTYQGVEYWKKGTNFYKAEKISWMILRQDEDRVMVVSEYVLDNHRFNERYEGTNKKGYYANDYAHSEIREWLNNQFLMTAFHDDSRIKMIKKTLIDNSESTTGSSSNQYACENTEDYVFLLSCQELENEYFSSDSERECYATEYCGTGARWYWTRSPDSLYSYYAWTVTHDGGLRRDGVGADVMGVRPALCFDFSGVSND